MSRHSFEAGVAKLVGVNAAVIYQNMIWWCEKNFANNRNIHDGYCWTYNSRRAWADLFDYLSEAQIRTALDKLLSARLIVKGDYNQNRYDRTSWYSPAITAEWIAKSVGENDPAHWSKITNGVAENVQPIPDSKPDIKPDNKPPYNPPKPELPDWMPLDEWHGWVDMRKQRKKPLTDRALVKAINKLDAMRQSGQNIGEVLDRSTMNGWTDLYEIREQINGNSNWTSGADRRSSLARAIDEGLDFLG